MLHASAKHQKSLQHLRVIVDHLYTNTTIQKNAE